MLIKADSEEAEGLRPGGASQGSNKMIHRSTWKKFERQLAKDEGATRTPLSGSASGHTGADTAAPSNLFGGQVSQAMGALDALRGGEGTSGQDSGLIPQGEG